jgi:molecular chaperone HtpG
MAEESPKQYLDFYKQFGMILKEGIARDPMNRDRIARLLRFTSTHAQDPDAPASLDDYVKRAPESQKVIYYLGGPSFSTIKKSPNLEIFRRRNLEVLFLTEAVDEFVLSALETFEGRKLVSIDSAEIELPPEPESNESEARPGDQAEAPAGGFGRVLGLFREALGDRVKDVRESKRLTDSPCCLVNAEPGVSIQMQRIMKLANKDFPTTARALEINPSAPLIRRLQSLSANPDHDAFIKQCALQLWSNAMLLEGSVPEPEALVVRSQAFMEEAAEKRSPIVL